MRYVDGVVRERRKERKPDEYAQVGGGSKEEGGGKGIENPPT